MGALRRLAWKALGVWLATTALLMVVVIIQERGSTGSRIGSGVVAVLFAAGAWWSFRRSGGGDGAAGNSEALAREAFDYLQEVNRLGSFPAPPDSRVMSSASDPVLAACNARMFEVRQVTRRRSVGTRIKLGGMPIYVGESTPVTSAEVREAASGELAITSRALLFVGDAKSADVDLSRVTSVEVHRDGVSISARGRQRPLMFQVANPLLWAQLIRNVPELKLDGRALKPGAELRVR